MNKRFLSTLLASSTLVLVGEPIFAQDSSQCKLEEGVKEVTVIDGKALLRADANSPNQNIPGATPGERATINEDDKLQIVEGKQPQEVSGTCFYPVKLTQEDTKAKLSPAVLAHSPYWISKAAVETVKDVETEPSPTPTASSTPIPETQEGGFLPSWFSAVPSFALDLLTLGTLILIFLRLSSIKKADIKLDKIVKAFQDQALTRPQELNNLQFHIERNKEHVKGVEALLEEQNTILNTLTILMRSSLNQPDQDIPPDLAPTDTRPYSAHPGYEYGNFYDAIPGGQSGSYRPQPELLQPTINTTNYPSQEPQEAEATHDSFAEVTSKFNDNNIQWFNGYIQQGNFQKVQITPASVVGQMDMGGKITLLEPDQKGTLLIYSANNRYWLIPNINELKWKRAASADLFSGSPNNKLIRPAEVQQHGDKWKLVEKGEFQA